MSDDITTGEVVRRLDRFEKTTADAFKALSDKLDSMNVVYKDVYEANRAADDLRFKALEAGKSRSRAFLDAVAAPLVIALVIALGSLLATGNAHIGG